MDTQKPITHSPKQPSENSEFLKEFEPGTIVIYATHGKCHVIGVETREINGQPIRFYKLEIQKSSLSRSTAKDPAIWIPVSSAKERGLRLPLNSTEAENVMKILLDRDSYYETITPWSEIHPKLEAVIRSEGAIGLAKVASYLYVLKRRLISPSADISRFQETVNKLLLRELSEATQESIRTLEDKIAKSFRHKVLRDN